MPPSFPRRLAGLLPALVLILATLAAHAPALSAGFIWDDDGYVTKNDNLLDLDGLVRTWIEPRSIPQYYPLVHTSFWLERHLFGLEPFGYHMVNLLLQAGAALLLWRLLVRLGLGAAWPAALLFALHPVGVETVAWVTERKNLLSALFSLVALRVYVPALERDRLSRRAMAWVALAFVAALLCKSVAAALPGVMLVLAWWKRGTVSRADLVRTLPLAALGVAAGLFTAYLERTHVGAEGEAWRLSLAEHVLLAGRIPWFYLAKLAWPAPLIFFYPRWELDPSSIVQWLFPCASVLVLVLLFLARRRIGRGPLAALLLFGGMLVPCLGLFAVYPMRYSWVADHFQYAAAVPVLVLLATGLERAGRRLVPGPEWSALILPLALGALYGSLSWRHARDFADPTTLWNSVLRDNPDAWIAHNNLGIELLERGELEEAARHFERALELEPGHVNARYNLGLLYTRKGDLAEAERHYRAALAENPEQPRVLSNLGTLLVNQGRLREGLAFLRRALHIRPGMSPAQETFAEVQRYLRQHREADR